MRHPVLRTDGTPPRKRDRAPSPSLAIRLVQCVFIHSVSEGRAPRVQRHRTKRNRTRGARPSEVQSLVLGRGWPDTIRLSQSTISKVLTIHAARMASFDSPYIGCDEPHAR